MLQPLHLRRIALLKITSNKGEKASALMTKLLEASKVADLENLSPEALIPICSWTNVLKERTPRILKVRL